MRHLRLLIILIFIGFVIWRLWSYSADFSRLSSLKQAFEPAWIVSAVAAQLLIYFADGWLSQIVLKIINFNINLKDTIRIAALNVLAARFSPVGETGALLTLFYFFGKLGVPAQKIIFVSLAWGSTSILVVIIIAAVSLLFTESIPRFTISPTNIIAAAAVVLSLVFLTIKRRLIWPRIKKSLQKNAWTRQVSLFLESWPFWLSLIKKKPQQILAAACASSLYHGTNIVILGMCFLSLGTSQSWQFLALAYTAAIITGWISLAPGGIGAGDAAMILVFLHFGADPLKTTAAVLIYRLLTSLLPIPAAALAYVSLKKEWKSR